MRLIALDDDLFGSATFSVKKSRYPHNESLARTFFFCRATIGFTLIPSSTMGFAVLVYYTEWCPFFPSSMDGVLGFYR